jgi:transposase
MMSRQARSQSKLFYTGLNLDQRVRPNHPLRKIHKAIDFDFIYDEVAHLYGTNGNPSVAPPLILKLMLLLVFYNVRSERELMDTVPERLDWLWFLGLDLDSDIPNHSVLSKARKRWGVEVFRNFFERIVWQCVEVGLVDGSKLFMDASIVEADVSMESVVDIGSIKHQLHQSYPEFERRLEEQEELDRPSFKKVNKKRVSTTDPEAAITRDGGAKLAYKIHRGVDGLSEIITATRTTPGDTHESHVLEALIDEHETNTEETIETVIADAQYGTVENLLKCHDRGVNAHMPHLGKAAQKRNAARGIFGQDRFQYDLAKDAYICPNGQELKRSGRDRKNNHLIYRASKLACKACDIKDQCTKSKSGRSIRRHERQAALDKKHSEGKSHQGKRDIRTRQHLMERSFARGKRYSFDRSRWRGLWRMEIQELLTCAVQNIQVLVNKAWQRPTAEANRLRARNGGILSSIWLFRLILAAHKAILCQLQPTQRCMLVLGIVRVSADSPIR